MHLKKATPFLLMRCLLFFFFLFCQHRAYGQQWFQTLFKNCRVTGSTTVYDYANKRWFFTDSADAYKASLPASTFKIINLLIALETGVIKSENDTIAWVGKTDTARYGYRPDIYHSMTVKEAFTVSAGWVFIELAKKIGRERYRYYLARCRYGNGNLSEQDVDFWNFGAFAVSPVAQVQFLVAVYEGKTPFAARNIAILKKVMITEQTGGTIIRSKTGWTRINGYDSGWWVGYVERNGKPGFFATRIAKKRSAVNPDFGDCRKTITKEILRRLRVL